MRPEITLPDYSGIEVSVDSFTIGDDDIEEQLTSLRQRFGTLTGVERAVADGDFVSIDLSATVDGADVPEAATTGLSHEVGSGQLIEGLDEAVIGLKAGESAEFTSTLVAGDHAGSEAVITVTVQSVKERELPEADDEFAQLASEFDTIDELKEDLKGPVVKAEVDAVVHDAVHGFDHDDAKLAEALEAQGSSREEFDKDTQEAAEKSVKTQLLLDAIAEAENTQVGQQELTERILFQAQRYGMSPEQFIQQVQQAGQLGAVFADVRRGKALAGVVGQVKVTDSDGNVVDTTEMFGDPADSAEIELDEAAAE